MEYGLVLERVAAHHIHVDVGPQSLPDLWMGRKKCHGALNLRSPDEAQGALRAR